MDKQKPSDKKKRKKFLEGSNICSVCGKRYDYQVKVICLPNGERRCFHDDEFEPGLHFDLTDHRIIKNLPKGKVLAKGSDGISRVCDVCKNSKKQ